MEIKNRFKYLLILLPLLILFLILLIRPSKEFVISKLENCQCDEIVKIGSIISSINNREITSLEDFENIKREIKPNQTFFIILDDNKIIKCKAFDNFEIEIKETEKKMFLEPLNLKRFIIEKNEKNLKILNFLSHKNYIVDDNKIILPYDEKLYLLLTSKKNLDFYLERDLERENETVKILDKNVLISDLYEIFDEVIVGEKNVTVRKYLFNQNFVEDFDFKVRYLYPTPISFANITFKINSTAKDILKNYLKEIPLKLIRLEKYYDAKLIIRIKNVTIFDNYLPYSEYLDSISIEIINLENPEKLKEMLALQIFEVKKVEKEEYFKLFNIDKISFVLFLIVFVFIIYRTRNFIIFYFFGIIFSSFFFPFILPIFLLTLFIILFIFKRKFDVELIFFLLFTFILSSLYYQKTSFSFTYFFLSILFSTIFLYLGTFYNKKYENIIFAIFITSFLILFFSNTLISFSLFLTVFVNFLIKKFESF